MLAILVIPAALCWTFGEMVRDRRQGWAVLAAMLLIFVPLLAATYAFEAEQSGNPALQAFGVDAAPTDTAARRQHGGQGNAFRHRGLGAVGHGHDGGFATAA